MGLGFGSLGFRGFGSLGFGARDLEFTGLGFRGLGFRVWSLGYKSCMPLRTLNYGNDGIFLIMGNAGFKSSSVGV